MVILKEKTKEKAFLSPLGRHPGLLLVATFQCLADRPESDPVHLLTWTCVHASMGHAEPCAFVSMTAVAVGTLGQQIPWPSECIFIEEKGQRLCSAFEDSGLFFPYLPIPSSGQGVDKTWGALGCA